jgi:AraC-like DNA-binding protein
MNNEQQSNSTISFLNDVRLIIPQFLSIKLKEHPLTKGLYPTVLGKNSSNATYKITPHNKTDHILIYCIDGHGLFTFNNKKRKVSRGDLVVLPANQNYLYQTDNKHKGSIYWVHFNGDLADDFTNRLTMKMEDNHATVGILANILADFENLLELASRGYTATNVIHAVHVLQQALSFLALQLRLKTIGGRSNFDVTAIEKVMREHLHKELSLAELANYCKISKYHFSKKFKALTDTSPIQHFINMKIQQACFQLDNSDFTIKFIAEQLGYNDPYYFSRLFKKIVGLSPQQYRQAKH